MICNEKLVNDSQLALYDGLIKAWTEEEIDKAELSPGSGITIEDKTINANTNANTISEIQISDGSPITALGIWPDNKIPQGTSVQAILEKLLSKEIFPSEATKPNFTVSDVNLGVREFDTLVTVSAPQTVKNQYKFNAQFTKPRQPEVEGIIWSSETESSQVISGFTNRSGDVCVVVLGENRMRFTFVKDYNGPDNYPITNLGNQTQSTTKISMDDSDLSATWAANSITKTADVTVTGVYPCFSNINGNTLIEEPSIKAALTSGNTITFINAPGENPEAGIRLIFSYPADRKATFQTTDVKGNWVPFAGETDTTISEDFYKEKDYKLLTTKGDVWLGAGQGYRLIFDKPLNQ